jgi:hypothetical protein
MVVPQHVSKQTLLTYQQSFFVHISQQGVELLPGPLQIEKNGICIDNAVDQVPNVVVLVFEAFEVRKAPGL